MDVMDVSYFDNAPMIEIIIIIQLSSRLLEILFSKKP